MRFMNVVDPKSLFALECLETFLTNCTMIMSNGYAHVPLHRLNDRMYIGHHFSKRITTRWSFASTLVPVDLKDNKHFYTRHDWNVELFTAALATFTFLGLLRNETYSSKSKYLREHVSAINARSPMALACLNAEGLLCILPHATLPTWY
jgi:hypothetical protein